MSKLFLKIMKRIFKNEGLWSNDKDDRGGATWMGITQNNWPKWYDRMVNAKDNDERYAIALEFYYELFWKAVHLDDRDNEEIAYQIMDLAVNSGPGKAFAVVRDLQQTLNWAYRAGLKEDGWLGEKTAAAIDTNFDVALEVIKALRTVCFINLAANDATQRKFLVSWFSRIIYKKTEEN